MTRTQLQVNLGMYVIRTSATFRSQIQMFMTFGFFSLIILVDSPDLQ